MHKDVGRWFEEHPETYVSGDGLMVRGHPSMYHEAGGFLYLVCQNCYVLQSVDEIDAGAPVAPGLELRQ